MRGRVFRLRAARRPTARAATGGVDAKRGVGGENGHPTSLPSGAGRRRAPRCQRRSSPDTAAVWPAAGPVAIGMGGRCRRCRRSPQVDAEAVVDGGRFLQPVEAGGDLRDLFGELVVDADRFR